MQALIQKFLFSKNCIFTLWHFLYQTSPKFSLLLPSHNCIIITMFSFQGANSSFTKKLNEASLLWNFSQFLYVVEISGIEPLTSCLQGRRSPSWAKPPYLKWWAKMDSNHRPHDYQSCALASWAIGPYWFLTSLQGTLLMYPLNWITHWWTFSSCTDLRTLLVDALLY